MTRYFRRWSIYIGGENLANFKQKNPIIDAYDPWGSNFDATMVGGPMHGAKAYVAVSYTHLDVYKRQASRRPCETSG